MVATRILIVDDQREVSRLLRSGLEALEGEFEIRDVLSGEEALLEITSWKPQLLIADIRLPGISGFDLMNRARSRNISMKIILISGVSDPTIRRRVAEAGADAFFYKPVNMPDFLDSVERTLGMVGTLLAPEMELEKTIIDEENKAIEKSEDALIEDDISITELLDTISKEMGAEGIQLIDSSGNTLHSSGIPIRKDDQSFNELLGLICAITVRIKEMNKEEVGPQIFFQEIGKRQEVLSVVDMTHFLLTHFGEGFSDSAGKQGIIYILMRELTRELKPLMYLVESSTEKGIGTRLDTDKLMQLQEDKELGNILSENQPDLEQEDPDEFWSEAKVKEDDSGWYKRDDVLTFQKAKELGIFQQTETPE
ncbi:MAG: response regulator [Anaerolineales bacterium]|nr:response regulator [Anaerolineales bacterium]